MLIHDDDAVGECTVLLKVLAQAIAVRVHVESPNKELTKLVTHFEHTISVIYGRLKVHQLSSPSLQLNPLAVRMFLNLVLPKHMKKTKDQRTASPSKQFFSPLVLMIHYCPFIGQ